jgi:hypothetical protein
MSTQENSNELPPHYAEFAATLPMLFTIGNQQVSPLVKIRDLQAHLRLLAAFDKLRSDVINQAPPYTESQTVELESTSVSGGVPSIQDSQGHGLSTPENEQDRLWTIFVHRAVYRFDSFMRAPWAPFPRWSEASILPLDVLMVWHSYLLVSPCNFIKFLL